MAQQNGRNGNAVDELIDAFYDTAIAETERCAWCNVLPKLCNALEASAGSFLVHDFSSQEGALRHEFNIRPEFRDAYGNGLSACRDAERLSTLRIRASNSRRSKGLVT